MAGNEKSPEAQLRTINKSSSYIPIKDERKSPSSNSAHIRIPSKHVCTWDKICPLIGVRCISRITGIVKVRRFPEMIIRHGTEGSRCGHG